MSGFGSAYSGGKLAAAKILCYSTHKQHIMYEHYLSAPFLQYNWHYSKKSPSSNLANKGWYVTDVRANNLDAVRSLSL